jgi:diguanylate cyclase (GGDEF)-like protein
MPSRQKTDGTKSREVLLLMSQEIEFDTQGQKTLSGVGILSICIMTVLTAAAILCGIFIPVLSFGRDWAGRLSSIIIGSAFVVGGIVILVIFYMSSKIYANILASAEKESLVTDGLYAWVRNPIYSASLLINTGALLIYGNYLFAVLPLIYWIFLSVVVRETEEKYMKLKFGAEYDRYCEHVNRLIPWLPPAKSAMVNEYRKTLRIVVSGIIISVIFITMFSKAISAISARITYESMLTLKKTMLQETVDSTIAYIDEYVDGIDKTTEGPSGFSKEMLLEHKAEQMLRSFIYNQKFSDGTYMWVNKVLDFNGGDGYATRLIHPNLKDTEGQALSTNTVNEMGMKAYEEELNGVKENGWVYLNYAFKKIDSDEVTEKVTYSCLYKRFNWIVCMGVNLDSINTYQTRARNTFGIYHNVIMIVAVTIWIGFLMIALYVYRRAHLGIYETKNRELSNKLNMDPLTGAGSRLFGEKALADAYADYKAGHKDTLLLIADIDYFKQFNDGYGHDVGDKVLRAFTEAVKKSTRSNDSVIRWGGDEFIVILRNIPARFQPEAGDRILSSVRAIKLPELPEDVRITASMGFAYFDESDEDAKSTLSRADAALYRAKEAGRNNWKI